MQQVLFRIPFPWWGDVPIYGFGAMLVVALVLGIWIACRRAKQNNVNPDRIQDATFWVIITGVVGARLVHMIQFRDQIHGPWLLEFFMFWKGGLVFYGALIGGILGYLLAWRLVLRKHKLSGWKLADITVPSVALGLCIGRIGCLLNGCCYGGVASPGLPALHFPADSYAGKAFGERASEASKAAGFCMDLDALDKRTVAWVAPGTAAAAVGGLQLGDTIIKVDGLDVPPNLGLEGIRMALSRTEVLFKVRRGNDDVPLPPIQVETLELHRRDLHDVLGIRGTPIDKSSFVVTDMLPENGQAAKGGLEKGDVVIEPPLVVTVPKNRLSLTVVPQGDVLMRSAVTTVGVGLMQNDPCAAVASRWQFPPQDASEFAPREVPPFAAQTIGLHPTQVYESISTLLIFLLLTAYFPLRKRDGEVLVLFLFCYPVHRFLDEALRNDTLPVAFGMTLSQNVSLLVLLGAAVLAVIVLRRTPRYDHP